MHVDVAIPPHRGVYPCVNSCRIFFRLCPRQAGHGFLPGGRPTDDQAAFRGDGFGYGYGFAVRTSAGETKQPGSIGELKWDGLSGTYVGIDPELDMFYLLMEQTDTERGPIRVAFRKLVYDAFTSK